MQIDCGRSPVWINKQRVRRDTVGVLACGCLPIRKRGLNGAVKEPYYAIDAGSIKIIEIARETWGIRSRPASCDRDVGYAA